VFYQEDIFVSAEELTRALDRREEEKTTTIKERFFCTKTHFCRQSTAATDILATQEKDRKLRNNNKRYVFQTGHRREQTKERGNRQRKREQTKERRIFDQKCVFFLVGQLTRARDREAKKRKRHN